MDITSFVLGYQKGKASGGGSGGGGSADVRYVTFMSYDGSKEYGKKAVAVGDDCADPIARGIFATPTRESTAQYDYTFVGWATTPNGAWDENALKAVTADRTLYAAYASAVRYYTITYLDSDGVTVLKTESLAYGSTPVGYIPEKEGFSFVGWAPDFAVVTGNASYTASWIEGVTFAGSSWAKIAEISESGQAADYFAVGDERTVPVTIGGVTYNFVAKIVGFNSDTTEDGATVGITCMFHTVPSTAYTYGSSITYYINSAIYAEAVKYGTEYLPSDLREVLKAVKKETSKPGGNDTGYTTYEKTWIPSCIEMGKANTNGPDFGTKYELFTTYYYGYQYETKWRVFDTDGTRQTKFWTRSASRSPATSVAYITGGSIYSATKNNLSSATAYLAIGFCI